MGLLVTACAHHIGGECTSAAALPLYGPRPSAGVCRVCAHYEGPDRGLGDTVHRVARATGVARVVRAVTGGDCGGCAERRKWLNGKIAYGDGGNDAGTVYEEGDAGDEHG